MQKELGELGNKQVRALLNEIVVDTVQFFQVGKMMGGPQVVETVGFILEDFKHLKPEDLILCFNKAKKGHYGQLFDRIDGQIILSWLNTYDSERTATIESIRARENRQIKQATVAAVGKPDDEKYKKLFDENMPKLMQQLDESKKQRDIQKEQVAAERTIQDPVREMHQRWINQFDKLWIKQGAAKGTKMVRKYGKVKNPKYFPGCEDDIPAKIPKMLDINAYLWYKNRQYNHIVINGNRHYKPKN